MKVFYKQVQLNPTTETDYTDLVNKPSINGVELEGDLSTEQIKVTWYGTQEEFDALPSHDPYTFYIIDDGTPVGTQDSYLDLADKPSINGQVLTGNKLPSDLDMYSRPDVDNLLASMRSIKVVATKPAAPAANTMYYVGPDSESNYHVYLYDALLNEIDLGMAMNQLYREGTAIDIDSANTISVKIDDETIKTNSNNELYVKKLDTTLTKGANTANAVKAVWIENGDVKEHTVNSGNSTRPVYIDAGTIKPVNQAASGTYTNFVPYVANNGVLDGGQFIDFHTPTSTQDYDYRLFYNEGETDLQVKKTPSTPGATILTTAHLDGTTLQWNNTNKTAYVNNSNTIVGTTNVDKIGMTKGAIQKYTDNLISGDTATIIPANTDLNTVAFTEVGNYVCGRSSDAQTLTNCPTKIGFKMVVESINSQYTDPLSSSVTWDYRLRTIKGLDGGVFKQRVYTDGTGVIIWGDWIPTLAGDTTASENRFNVYPYVRSSGYMPTGQAIEFYSQDNLPDSDNLINSLMATSTDGQWLNAMAGDLVVAVASNRQHPERSGVVLTTGIMSQMPEVFTSNLQAGYENITTWKNNTYNIVSSEKFMPQLNGNAVNTGIKKYKATTRCFSSTGKNVTQVGFLPVVTNSNNVIGLCLCPDSFINGTSISSVVHTNLSAQGSPYISYTLPTTANSIYHCVIEQEWVRGESTDGSPLSFWSGEVKIRLKQSFDSIHTGSTYLHFIIDRFSSSGINAVPFALPNGMTNVGNGETIFEIYR